MSETPRNSDYMEEWPDDVPPDTTPDDKHVVLYSNGTRATATTFESAQAATDWVLAQHAKGVTANYQVLAVRDAQRDGKWPQ